MSRGLLEQEGEEEEQIKSEGSRIQLLAHFGLFGLVLELYWRQNVGLQEVQSLVG